VYSRMIQVAFSAAAIALASGLAHAQAPAAAPAAPVAGGAPAAPPAPPFVLTSPDFKDGQMMPAKYGDIRTPACGPEAMKISPALAWTGTPARAVTLVLTMLDVDAGLGAAHFIVFDIPKEVSSLAAGALTADPKGAFVAGTNYRMEAYSGPCPGAGPAHHYVITLWATDLAPGTLKPTMTRDQVLAALTGHNVGVANIIGLYQRP
jgi:Raf kinase inhibitor-like YbhB/YbcL family protein